MVSKNRLRTPLCNLLRCDVPILLAGMGGVARWELAAGVAQAGGFAALGMVRESPELIATEVKALQSATDRRFAVNLIPAATDPTLLDAQIKQCLTLGVTAFSFFWDVLPDVASRVKREGALVLHQVGTVEQARRAEGAGADVIIAQGSKPGGMSMAAPSLSPERAKVADFYAARSGRIPPLSWPTLSPTVSHDMQETAFYLGNVG